MSLQGGGLSGIIDVYKANGMHTNEALALQALQDGNYMLRRVETHAQQTLDGV